jgi:SNF5 / SMARCB1 / INI1
MAASAVNKGRLEEDAQLPYLLVGEDVLFPMKIDVTIGGARIVDTFCWRVYNSFVTPDEFAWQLCSDLNLSASFQAAISMQIQEQVLGFQEMVTALRAALARGHRPPWSRMLAMNVGIRHFTVDYSDKFQWDIFSSAAVSPEDFARTTCADLGNVQS